MRIAAVLATVLVAAATRDASAFSTHGTGRRISKSLPVTNARGYKANNVNTVVASTSSNAEPTHTRASITTSLRATEGDASSDGGLFGGVDINPVYAAPYVFFLLFGFYMTSHEAAGASQVVLEKFIADPLHPGVNELFATVFNLIG